MRKVRFVYLILLILIVFIQHNLLSQSIEDIEIDPPNPTIYDSINIVIWGWHFQTNNIIVDTTVYISPNYINLVLYWEVVGIGLPIILPYSYSFPIGTLTEGIYYVLCESYFLQSYWSDDTTFTVTPGTYIDNNVNMLTCSELLTNYPNPFNPNKIESTTISFSATDLYGFSPSRCIGTGQAQIIIYNIKGQLVRHFEIRNPKSKINKIEWDGKDENGKPVPSGIYFSNLLIDKKIHDCKKIVLLR